MRLCKALLLLLVIGTGAGCSGVGGGGGGSNGSPPTPACIAGVSTSNTSNTSPTPASGDNVVRVTVNGDLCSAGSYLNKPCVQVTVCTPGSTLNCQTISDILLDTGSYGLRIFKQLLTMPLNQVVSGSGSLGECVTFGDNSSTWGPVQRADIMLGNERANNVPIQVIDATTFFASNLSAVCPGADLSPYNDGARSPGYSGILGVGSFIQDCGSFCTTSIPTPPLYYTCSGSNCTPTTVPLANQVQNPVALLPNDNNGVVVQLPAVGPDGQPSADGSLLLGIGTQANNIPVSVAPYPVDSGGNIITVFNNAQYTDSFLDTGSNGLFFPPIPSLPACQGQSQGNYWFCPSSPVCLSALTEGATGMPTSQDTFQIGNFFNLLTSNPSNRVFPDIGGNYVTFDWGLPFFLGRSVYIGIEGKASPYLGTGPYFAY